MMKWKTKLWEHQLSTFERFKDERHAALFMEMGVGKSATVIALLRYHYSAKKRLLRTLVVCPSITVKNWKNEWLTHSYLKPEEIVPLTGSGKKRLKVFQEEKDKERIFIVNFESLLIESLYAQILAWKPEALVFDESHRLKNPKAKQSKRAERLANPRGDYPVPLKYILSGSPILNSPMDIFHQFLILDGGETFQKSFFTFRRKYFVDVNAGMPKHVHFPNYKVRTIADGFDAMEDLNKRIFTKAVRYTKEEVLDLPPFIKKKFYVQMAPEQARVYKEMKKDFVATIGDKEAVATLVITKALRLMQIASAFVKTTDEKEHSFENNPKQRALEDLLKELTPEHKVIVWSVWKKTYEQIASVCEKIGVKYVEIHGGIAQDQKYKNVDSFEKDDDIRVCIGNPGSAGIGINMCAASYSVFYSRTFSYEQSIQAEARNYRPGVKHEKVTRIDLVTEGTIDELVCDALDRKEKISDALLKKWGSLL